MDPRHDPRVKAAKRDAVVQARIAGRQGQAKEKYADPLVALQGISVAIKLMGDVERPDEFIRLVTQHIDHGFGVPKDIEAKFLARIKGGVLDGEFEYIPEVIASLLRVAVMGLKGGDRKFAYDLLVSWDRQLVWSDAQLAWAKLLLDKARNGVRQVG